MSKRECPIMLSESEKDRLDAASREMFGTCELPYGCVVSLLIGEYQKNSAEGSGEDCGF